MALSTPLKKQPLVKKQETVYYVLFVIGICHLLNDSLQAVIPAMFPILERSMNLTFTQLGFIAFALNMISSVMQPLIGWYTDKRPVPYALPIGLSSSMFGILGLAFAPTFETILLCVVFIGIGSAVFHPEGSRVAFLAAGPRRGLAQSIYQVGGNTGQALAPLITALVLVPFGQLGAAYFTLVAALAVIFLMYIAKWYSFKLVTISKEPKKIKKTKAGSGANRKSIRLSLVIIIFIIFASSWYISSISNFHAFYAIEKYGLSIPESQGYVFLFLIAGAVGTFLGGPFADRFGKRTVIIASLASSVPLALALPFAGPALAYILIAIIGLFLMSSFSVTVVYAQELIPGKIGMMSGLTVGLAFGMGAIGSVTLGFIIDTFGLTATMISIALLPILGTASFMLPSDQKLSEWQKA